MADFTSNTGEGRAYRFGAASFALSRSGTGSAGHDSLLEVRSDLSSFFIQRCFFPFDTSSIPDDATITAATLKLYRDDNLDAFSNADSTSVELVPQNQASNTAIADADYTTVTYSSIGSANFADFTNHVYKTITISDLTQISKTGHTKIAAISGRDLNNSAPTGSNVIAFQARGDANPPTLTVTYSVPSGAIGTFNFI